MPRKKTKAVPCSHIADYYQYKWITQGPQLGSNLLRIGYREWADGKQRKHHMNNLYGKRNRPTISVRAILVRDFNWRMGNLRRLEMGAAILTGKERTVVECSVRIEQRKQTRLHELRLWGEEMNLPDFDYIHAKARGEAMRNRAERFFWDSEG